MLPGVKIQNLKKFVDERGSFTEIFRDDWFDFKNTDKIVQTNVSHTHSGIIRAWHRHNQGQIDYFFCTSGAIKLCIYDDYKDSKTKGQIDQIVISEEVPNIVRVPGKYWHGYKTISPKSATVVYCTTKLYDYENPDEERRPWNDQSIIDSQTSKPFDWNSSPHK